VIFLKDYHMMKRFLLAAAVAATMAAAPASAAEVGVSINIGQPGFYGRIDIGNVPQPQFIYAQPVIIRRTAVVQQPVYLHVPPGHEKKWSKHCSKYNACNQRVYFVQNNWYNDVYVPSYRGRGDGDGYDNRDDHRGNDGKHGRGDDSGHGNGKDKGHWKDKGHGKGHKGD
jgi:hypothetical protein